jgi:hypothetical protein
MGCSCHHEQPLPLAVTTMTTIQLLKTSGADAGAPLPVCACGQDLDTCRRAHCPRCGCTLQGAAPVLLRGAIAS